LATRSIKAQTIWSRLRTVLDPSGTKTITPSDPAGKHIRGGAAAVRAFSNVLNNSPQFQKDGLALIAGSFAQISTIGDIGVKIIQWYQSNNWTVTI
jgi:hypothetical protein